MFTLHLSLCRDWHSEKACDLDLLKTLTEAGADLNVQGGAFGWSPIMKAANDGKIRIVIVLHDNHYQMTFIYAPVHQMKEDNDRL